MKSYFNTPKDAWNDGHKQNTNTTYSIDPATYSGDYRCKTCHELISPQVDTMKGVKKGCPRCGHKHPDELRDARSLYNMFEWMFLICAVTFIGIIFWPVVLPLLFHYKRKAKKLIAQNEYRIGEPVAR